MYIIFNNFILLLHAFSTYYTNLTQLFSFNAGHGSFVTIQCLHSYNFSLQNLSSVIRAKLITGQILSLLHHIKHVRKNFDTKISLKRICKFIIYGYN